jgi:hypothetical protein
VIGSWQKHIDRCWQGVFGDLGCIKEEVVLVATPTTERDIVVPHVNAFHCLTEILLG